MGCLEIKQELKYKGNLFRFGKCVKIYVCLFPIESKSRKRKMWRETEKKNNTTKTNRRITYAMKIHDIQIHLRCWKKNYTRRRDARYEGNIYGTHKNRLLVSAVSLPFFYSATRSILFNENLRHSHFMNESYGNITKCKKEMNELLVHTSTTCRQSPTYVPFLINAKSVELPTRRACTERCWTALRCCMPSLTMTRISNNCTVINVLMLNTYRVYIRRRSVLLIQRGRCF